MLYFKVGMLSDYFMCPFARCAPSMAQTSLSINAGTAALWLFSFALAPHTSAMPATMTSRGWQAYPRRNCLIVLQVPDCCIVCATWKNDGPVKVYSCILCPFCHRAQRQAAGGYGMPFACGSPTNWGGVCLGLWGVQKCSYFLKIRTVLKSSFSTVISGCCWGSAMKLGSGGGKFPGHWTRLLL